MTCTEILGQLRPRLPALELIKAMDALAGCAGQEAALALLPYLNHADYLVKSKAFAMLAAVAHPAALPRLFAVLRAEQDEEFRLRALEVIQKIAEPESVAELALFLADHDPLLIRGVIVALGNIGGAEAAGIILEFAASPRGRIIRRETVQEALAYALTKVKDPQQFLLRMGQDKGIRRYLHGLDLALPAVPRYTVYPSADYFSLQAKERGIEYKLYKKLIG